MRAIAVGRGVRSRLDQFVENPGVALFHDSIDRFQVVGVGRQLIGRLGARAFPIVFVFQQVDGQFDQVGDERGLVFIEVEVAFQDFLNLGSAELPPPFLVGFRLLFGHGQEVYL